MHIDMKFRAIFGSDCLGLFSLKSLSSVLPISRYILGLGQRGHCCFCAKMYLEIRSANEGAFNAQVIYRLFIQWCPLKLRSSRSDSNRRLRATVGQNSSSFQMASAYHVCAAVLVHVARRRRLDSDLDERSLWLQWLHWSQLFLQY